MVQIVFESEQHMNTNLLTASFVGDGNKRKKGKVTHVKVKNRFIPTEMILVLRGCVSLYIWPLNSSVFYRNSKAGTI